MSEHSLDAWEAASRHLRDHGLPPLVPPDVQRALRLRNALRALWQRGGLDRELAQVLHEALGEEAA